MAGWYCDMEDASECIKCSAGTVSSTASSACVPCKNGLTSQAGVSYCYHRTPPLLCGPGYNLEVNSDGDYECIGCPYNTWSPEGTRHSDACYDCPKGTQYSPERGCLPCPEGSRREIKADKAICMMCDPCETILVAGSTICMKCPKGSFSSSNGKCQYCWPAPYSDMLGSATCKPCPFDTSETVVGASKCEACHL